MLADQFQLKKSDFPKGWRRGMRDWPVVKGYHQQHFIVVYASKTTSTYRVNNSSYAHPLTVVSIKASQSTLETFKLHASKNYRKNKTTTNLIDASEFSQYFKTVLQPQKAELIQQYFTPKVQTALMEHLKRYKKANCTIILTEKGYWECQLFYEITNQKRYEAVLSMLNILLELNAASN